MHISINERNALKLLADAFSNRTTFLAELMQNARRAGASYIRFLYDNASNTLVVDDDGCSVTDFGVLLRLCESGWSEAVQESDAPYGVGFLSAIMASEHFEVSGKRGTLVADTDQLLAGHPATVMSYAVVSGTRITLKLRHRIDRLSDTLSKYACGFPLKVYVNNSLCSSRMALDSNKQTIDVPGVGTLAWTGGSCATTGVFLQGLPIAVAGGYGAWRVDGHDWALHLDSTIYRGRMPDRETVIDLEWAQIEAAVKFAQRALLTRVFYDEAKRCPSYELYSTLFQFGLHNLINEVEIIPAGVFKELTDAPDQIDDETGDSADKKRAGAVSRTDSFTYISALASIDDAEALMLARIAYANDVLLGTSAKLPDWAQPRRLDWYGIRAVPVNAGPVHALYVDAYGHMDVVQCDSVELQLLDEDDNVLLSCVEDAFCPLVDDVLYLTDRATSAQAHYFMQDTACWDDNSCFDHDAIRTACESFKQELKLALGSDPVELVAKACNAINRTELHGKRYAVLFNTRCVAAVEASSSDAAFANAIELLERVLRNRDVPDSLADDITALLAEVPRGQA